MAKEESARWHCPNRDCNWFMVAAAAEEGDVAPKCICGTEMKKSVTVQALSYLEFLRDQTANADEAEVDGE